jgi:hypothetical protein
MNTLSSLRQRLHEFARTDAESRALLIEAIVRLLAARAALVLVPFPSLARRLGAFVPPTDPRVAACCQAISDEQAALAAQIGWAVTRAARHVPFKAACLPQAIAARQMLKRRGIASVLYFGAAMSAEKPLDTHAWLDAAGVKVTGYPVARRFAEIACFV